MRVALCAVLVALLSAPGDAAACEPVAVLIAPHELDPAYVDDTVAPGTPQATFSISRHEGGNACAHSSCDTRSAAVYVDVTGSDDRTPAGRLGYILTITGGDPPRNMYSAVRDGMPVFQAQGSFSYGFDYDDHDYAFDLEVRTVDLNGNVSQPTLLHIAEHDGGCSTTTSVRSEWLVFPVIAFLLRRRRAARSQRARRAAASPQAGRS